MEEKKALTELQSKFLSVLFGEALGNFAEAKRLAGYSDYTTVAEVIAPIKDQIVSHVQDYLVANGPKAAMRIVGALDQAAPNANVLKAANDILNRVGVIEKRAQEGISLDVPAGGIFILPAKKTQVFTKVIEHEADEAEVLQIPESY